MIAKVMRLIWKGIRSFLLFWQDFLVGDSPEIAIGAVVVLGLAFAVHRSPILAAFTIPAAIIVLLIFSMWLGKNRE